MSTIVSVVSLLIKLMLLGNQQEIVACSWNSWIFLLRQERLVETLRIYQWFCRKHCLKASNYKVFRQDDSFKVWSANAEKSSYTLFNKNQAPWYFVPPAQAVRCGTVAIIIRDVLLSPHMCIRVVSLFSSHYKQSRRIYVNQRPIYTLNLKLKHELNVINFPRRVAC